MISYSNRRPLTRDQIIEREQKIYQQQKIQAGTLPEAVQLENVRQRAALTFRDRPFNIFVLSGKGYPPIVGRKIISSLYLEGKINAPNCSRITASMLLGILIKKNQTKDHITVQYHPFSNGEKLSCFNGLARDGTTDIEFPFRYIDQRTGKEKRCARCGWKISPEKAQNLANGEEHFRKYTKAYFKKIIKSGYLLYDPACSTGRFLSSVKQNFPGCRTVGQDLSKEMTAYARNYLDDIYTGDALKSPLPDSSVDIMFLRFLNSEIVTERKARLLFRALKKKVKAGGQMVLFGHTPVLLKKHYFLRQTDLTLLQTSGYDPKTSSIFQYYVLKKL